MMRYVYEHNSVWELYPECHTKNVPNLAENMVNCGLLLFSFLRHFGRVVARHGVSLYGVFIVRFGSQ